MISRPVGFLLSLVLLALAQFTAWQAKRRGKPFLAENSQVPSPTRLIVASALTLFAELAFIRWISVEVRVFAYFKNLALLLCFLGFGFGCALVAQKKRWLVSLQAFLGLLIIIRIPWPKAALPEGLSQNLGGANDIAIWHTRNSGDWISFAAAAIVSICLFVLVVSIFIPLGQTVSDELDRAKNALLAYSWNLLGSIAGVITFFLVSKWLLPPTVWMGLVLLGFAFLQSNRRDVSLVCLLLIPLVLILRDPKQSDREIIWTPYQEIEYTRQFMKSGEQFGGTMQVNHSFYQRIVNLSREFAASHPIVQREGEDNPYNLPFRFAGASPSVLVVGSGTGNDVAAALRHNSRKVDAVEIDPAILDLGQREHPEHPYESPIVSVHIEDARSFLKTGKDRYDLILFGLLDSHAEFSDYSNVRIDNFVYTEESLREASELLTQNGIVFVKFSTERPWMEARFYKMLKDVFGHPPVAFRADSEYTAFATCFVVSQSTYVEQVMTSDRALADLVRRHSLQLSEHEASPTTDDWPYLYQRDHRIPSTYCTVSLLVVLTAIIMFLRLGRPTVGSDQFRLFFFSMGAGFLLLETQIISRIALFFGTVWQVNGIAITALLAALLLANFFVERADLAPKLWIWICLVVSLAIAYWFPFDRIAGSSAVVGAIAVCVFAIPVLFAGMLFSSKFKETNSPSAALKANVLGAVAGGLLENLSLVFGLRALLLFAIALYSIAGLALWRGEKVANASA